MCRLVDSLGSSCDSHAYSHVQLYQFSIVFGYPIRSFLVIQVSYPMLCLVAFWDLFHGVQFVTPHISIHRVEITWQANTAHGIALTYWQNLLKVRVAHEMDHNGYMLGISYMVAAAVVAACRRSSILRGWTSLLVVLSTLSMGLLLMALTISDSQWVFYALLVGIQSIFEVSTSVSTFQVGCAVCKSVETGNGPRQPRLALLFCITGVLAGAVASLVQHVHPISRRFVLVAVAQSWLGHVGSGCHW